MQGGGDSMRDLKLYSVVGGGIVRPGGTPQRGGPTVPLRRDTGLRQRQVVHSISNNGCHNYTRSRSKTQ